MRYLKQSWAIALVVLINLLSLLLTPSFAAGDTPPRFFRVPVFFVTDRNLEKTKKGDVDFGPHRKYIGECKHDPYMGSSYCVVENTDGKLLNDRLTKLGWAEAERGDKPGAFKAHS